MNAREGLPVLFKEHQVRLNSVLVLPFGWLVIRYKNNPNKHAGRISIFFELKKMEITRVRFFGRR